MEIFEDETEKNSPLMEVLLEDVNKAEKFLNEVMENFDPVIENLGVHDETERSHETTLNKIFWKIYGTGNEGIAADRLGRTFSGMLREDLSKYTETLVMQGRIKVVVLRKKVREDALHASWRKSLFQMKHKSRKNLLGNKMLTDIFGECSDVQKVAEEALKRIEKKR